MWYNTGIEFIVPRAANTGTVRHEGLASMSDVNDTTPLRRCKKCQRELPLTSVYFAETCANQTWFDYKCRECKGGSFKVPSSKTATSTQANPVPRKKRQCKPYKTKTSPKVCSACHREYPRTTEFFYPIKTGGVMLHSKCKECHKREARENKHRLSNMEMARQRGELPETAQIIEEGVPQKICTRCEKKKPATLEFFHRLKRGLYGLQSMCKTCYMSSVLDWRQRNPSRMCILGREWRQRNAKKEKERLRVWQKNNPEKIRVVSRRRDARKRALPDTLTHEQWQHAVNYFNGCCAVCGRQANDLFGTHKLAMDHWIPISSPNCPGTVAINIVPLCHGSDGCNNSKNDSYAVEWLTKKFGKRKAIQILKRIEEYFETVR